MAKSVNLIDIFFHYSKSVKENVCSGHVIFAKPL